MEVKNKRGVLASVASAISDMESNIDAVEFDDKDGQNTIMDFTVEVRSRTHLAKVMRNIKTQDSVIRLSRKKG